ncbi:hypothetical protein PUN28_008194 [Cardiocondyla obscurior]|uniref:Uncharacterized protein n=1 Tax=Cardiocondyla obscurior TaxID=286306 RepID=A0AAW2FZ41_9HYME
MARSLVCEGQTGGVLAGIPFGDASVGRSGGDGPLPETSLSSTCKGTSIIEKIDDIEEIEMDEDLNATFTDKLNGSVKRMKVNTEIINPIDEKDKNIYQITPMPQRKPRKRIIVDDDSPVKKEVKVFKKVPHRSWTIEQSDDETERRSGAISLSEDSFDEPRKEKIVRTKSKNTNRGKS